MVLGGSQGIALQVFWFSKVLALLIQSCLSIITMATPLSAVRTMQSLSLLCSHKAMVCALVKLGLGDGKILGLN